MRAHGRSKGTSAPRGDLEQGLTGNAALAAREWKSSHKPHVYPRFPSCDPRHACHARGPSCPSPHTRNLDSSRLTRVMSARFSGHTSSNASDSDCAPLAHARSGCAAATSRVNSRNASREPGTRSAAEVICSYASTVACSMSSRLALVPSGAADFAGVTAGVGGGATAAAGSSSVRPPTRWLTISTRRSDVLGEKGVMASNPPARAGASSLNCLAVPNRTCGYDLTLNAEHSSPCA